MAISQLVRVGAYVVLPGKSQGRVVDRSVQQGVERFLVKLSSGRFIWSTGAHLKLVSD